MDARECGAEEDIWA